jgi:hypothetical protein
MYPNSGSSLTSNITSSLTTQIRVKVDNITIGAIQSIDISQNRNMKVIEECGTEGIVEIHPAGATQVGVKIARLVFDDLSITESLGRGFINIQAQRIPFNIQIMDFGNAGKNSTNVIVHTLHNCWVKSSSTPFNLNSFTIIQTADIVCEKITSMRDAMNAANGGVRSIPYSYDTIERATDLEGKSGRISSSGLAKRF